MKEEEMRNDDGGKERTHWNLFEPEELDDSLPVDSDDDDATPDFFNGEGPIEPPKEKKPKFSREDPAFWDQEESDWEHLRPTRIGAMWMWVGGMVAAAILIFLLCYVTIGVRTDGMVKYGYLTTVEQRGKFFKTFEGELIPYAHVDSVDSITPRDTVRFTFSIDKRAVADIKALRDSVTPVRIHYREYNAKMPWRGETPYIVTAVDTVDITKLKKILD